MFKSIEKLMDEYLVKKAPFQIPKEGRKGLVEWFPWIALIFGILQLLAAWNLWRAGHYVDQVVNYWNDISRAYGVDSPTYDLGPTYYVAVGAIVVSAALLLIAFPGLKDKSKKRGWDILLISTLFNLAYGVIAVFVDGRYGGGFGSLLGAAIGALIGFYLLAQVKSLYSDKAEKSTTKKSE